MRHFLQGSVAFGLTAILIGSAAAQDYSPTDEHIFVYGRIPADFSQRVQEAGGEVVRLHHLTGIAVARGLSDPRAAELAPDGKWMRDLQVQMIPGLGEQWPLYSLGEATVNCRSRSCPYNVTAGHDPTDALFFPLQWNMQIIDADDAWNAGFEGNPNVAVAILDTGIDPFHQDLFQRVDEGRSIAFTPSLNPDGPDWGDDNFHGTHVAGTVVTNGLGTSGMAPHTTLIAVKVCNFMGSCTFSAIIGGILHAADVGADVINMSLGGSLPKNLPGAGPLAAALNKAVNFARQNGTLVVSSTSAGDPDLDHNGNVTVVPCESGSGMCISATGPDDLLSSYSSFGASVINVAAPGGDFIDTLNSATSTVLAPCSTLSLLLPACQPGGFYLFLQGTSMAAAHVSGAAALLDAQSNGALNAAQLQSQLQQSSDDLGKPGADPDYGKGRINVCRLLGCQ